MKKVCAMLSLAVILIICMTFNVSAETIEDLGKSTGVYTLSQSLPENVRKDLDRIGLSGEDFSTIENLSFDNIIAYLGGLVGNEVGLVLPSLSCVLASLLLYSVFSGVFENTANSSLSSVLSVVSSLIIACFLLVPVTNLIESAQSAIKTSADFMLCFIPVMTAVLISSGQALTGGGYCAMMVVAAEGVAQFFSKFISPLLTCMLSLGVTSSVVPDIKIGGFVSFLSKSVKWVMSFVFTLFTALLSFKSIYNTSVDNVSSRALRYTISSFVPVVGGALSEAYRTVRGSMGVLKSGVGVFVIIAVITVFLPVLTKLCIWLFTLNMCKSFAETSELYSSRSLLDSVTVVLSLLVSVIFCIMALFIITTALIITIGGSA